MRPPLWITTSTARRRREAGVRTQLIDGRVEALRGKIDLLLAGPPCQGHSNLTITRVEETRGMSCTSVLRRPPLPCGSSRGYRERSGHSRRQNKRREIGAEKSSGRGLPSPAVRS